MISYDDKLGIVLLRDFGLCKNEIAEIFGLPFSTIKRVIEMQNAIDRRKEDNFGQPLSDARRYASEVAAYLKAHPTATTFDLALECHFSDAAARRLIHAYRQTA